MQTGLVLAWLYTIAEKRLVDELRRRARTKAHLRQIPRSRVAVVDDPYGAVLADAIRRAIERLPSSQRRVVVMKVFNRARALQPPPNRYGVALWLSEHQAADGFHGVGGIGEL